MKSLFQVLPLAFVMIAGPQILSSVFLATSRSWAKNSLAYIGGAAVSITAIVTLSYFFAKGLKSAAGHKHAGTIDHLIDWVILALLVILILRVYLKRADSRPPKWMGRLQSAEPRLAALLGLVLLGILPTDLLTSVTVGLHIGRHGEAWWQCLPFVAVTLLLLALPAIGVVCLGKHADTVLPRVRDWMSNNSWVVSEVVLVFFVGITVNSLAG